MDVSDATVDADAIADADDAIDVVEPSDSALVSERTVGRSCGKVVADADPDAWVGRSSSN